MIHRHVCIHGHFYQPPRENPWLEAIEVQDSAYPYHDWNERVTAECYAPMAAARILTSDGDDQGRIARIVSNYSSVSFNFGPTLLAWMETARPELYEAILEADRRSIERFGGHGAAIAQAHSHLILPLANERDRHTQVLWGLADFRHRFGREPEGMWLAETAVDTPTLEALAAQGVKYTILAPHQAARVRSLASDEAQGDERDDRAGGEAHAWQDVGPGTLDTTHPYLCRLPSGRSIALFFYDGPLSHALSFGELLKDGERFARKLLGAFPDTNGGGEPDRPRLVHVATDGETYGHHHRYGEMALAYALDRLERDDSVRLTVYGELLAEHPPEHEVQIAEGTSWSCAHGVERWRSDCGCSTGGEPGWHQRWRAPLREALDWLRDELAPRYEAAAGELLRDPWAARDGYVEVLLDRSDASLDRFFAEHATHPLSPEERVRARRLLELQRHAMTMYTSCGWFFNDLAGIETIQVLQYADRVLQLAQRLFGESFEEGFLSLLTRAESNRPLSRSEPGSPGAAPPLGGNGREIFEREVRPSRVNLMRVGAHYALSSLFEDYPEEARIFCYRADQSAVRRQRSGRAQVATGRLHLESLVTGAQDDLTFAVLHLGDHHLSCGVRRFQGEGPFAEMAAAVAESFRRADFTRVFREIDRHFEGDTYTLDSLFRDERRLVLSLVLQSTRAEAEAQHRRIYEDHAPLMQYLSELRIPLPNALRAAAEVVVDLDLRRAFEDPEADLAEVEPLLAETAAWGLDLDTEGLALALQASLERRAEALAESPEDAGALASLHRAVVLAKGLPFHVSLYGVQTVVYRLLHGEGAEPSGELRELAAALGLRVG
jgi:alpha-amylase/alpha-mannosidase (GH57 family)